MGLLGPNSTRMTNVSMACVSAGRYLLFLHQGVRERQHSFITRIAPGPECHAPSTTCGTWPEVPEFEYTA